MARNVQNLPPGSTTTTLGLRTRKYYLLFIHLNWFLIVPHDQLSPSLRE